MVLALTQRLHQLLVLSRRILVHIEPVLSVLQLEVPENHRLLERRYLRRVQAATIRVEVKTRCQLRQVLDVVLLEELVG